MTFTTAIKKNLDNNKPGTENLEAYMKFLQGREIQRRQNQKDNHMARKILEAAIALDPKYPMAYARLGWTYWFDVWFKWSESPRESLKQAMALAKTCLELDDSLPDAHGILSAVYYITRQHENAIAEAEKAIALDPNSADAHVWLGMALFMADKPEEAILSHQRSIRLNPFPPSAYFHLLGAAYREVGRYEEAITACRKAIHLEPNNIFAHIVLAATYSISGREDKARSEVVEILRIDPKFSLERFAKVRPHIDPENTARLVAVLRKAGLK